MKLEDFLWINVEQRTNTLVGEGDAERIECVVNGLISPPVPQSDSELAIACAVKCLYEYRKALRMPAAQKLSHELPVAKAVSSDIGGGRFYWRVSYLMEGVKFVTPAVKYPDKNKGTVHDGYRKAVEIYISGMEPLELIPPDIDLQLQTNENQRNTSTTQPQGLTVRQREKKR